MADSFVSRFGCYTIIWDTTRTRSPPSPQDHNHRQRCAGRAPAARPASFPRCPVDLSTVAPLR